MNTVNIYSYTDAAPGRRDSMERDSLSASPSRNLGSDTGYVSKDLPKENHSGLLLWDISQPSGSLVSERLEF